MGYFFGDGNGCDSRIVISFPKPIILISYLSGLGGVVEVVVDAVDFGIVGECHCCGDEGNEDE